MVLRDVQSLPQAHTASFPDRGSRPRRVRMLRAERGPNIGPDGQRDRRRRGLSGWSCGVSCSGGSRPVALSGRPQCLAGAAEGQRGLERTGPAAFLSPCGCPAWGGCGACPGLCPRGAGAGRRREGKRACVRRAGTGCVDLQSVFRSPATPGTSGRLSVCRLACSSFFLTLKARSETSSEEMLWKIREDMEKRWVWPPPWAPPRRL